MNKKIIFALCGIVIIVSAIIGFLTLSSDGKVQKTDEKTLSQIKSSPGGAVDPYILYADEKRVVMCDYAYLVVYDLSSEKITHSLNFKEFDIMIQGSEASFVSVSKDGKNVLVEKQEEKDESFIFNIDENKIEYYKNSSPDTEKIFSEYETFMIYDYYIEEETEKQLADEISRWPISGVAAKIEEGTYFYLSNRGEGDFPWGDLHIIYVTPDNTKTFAVFSR